MRRFGGREESLEEEKELGNLGEFLRIAFYLASRNRDDYTKLLICKVDCGMERI